MMSKKNRRNGRKLIIGLLMVFSMGILAIGCSVERTVTIKTIPRGGTVYINDHWQGRDPQTKTVKWEGSDDKICFKATKSGYDDKEKSFTGSQAKKEDKEFTIELELESLQEEVAFWFDVPEGTRVSIDGTKVGHRAMNRGSEKISFNRKSGNDAWNKIHVKFDLPCHYPTQVNGIALDNIESKWKEEPYKTVLEYKDVVDGKITRNVEFEGIRRWLNISTVPTESEVEINGESIGKSPIICREFQWENQEPILSISTSKYGFENTSVTYSQAEANREKKEFNIPIQLPELRKDATLIINSKPVTIGADQLEIEVEVDGSKINTTKYPISFTRRNSKTEFSKIKLRLSCPRCYPAVVDGKKMPEPKKVTPYETYLDINDIDGDGNVIVDVIFEPVKVFATSYVEFIVTSKGVKLREKLVYATTFENWETESSMAKVQRVKGQDFKKNELFITRLTTNPITNRVILSVPRYDTQNELSGAQIVEFGVTPGVLVITDGVNNYDLFPAYSPDGGRVFFSSNREETRMNIHSRKVPVGGVGMTAYTHRDTHQDIEPAVNPVTGTVAYTALDGRGGATIATFEVGGDKTTYFSGRSPDWSADGKKMLWIERDRVSNLDVLYWSNVLEDSVPSKLFDDSKIEGAKWHPDGEHIIYAAARETHLVTEQPNFDIYAYSLITGDDTRLTTNGSYDTQPAVTMDGKHIYFISNREAGMREDSGDWQVFRMDCFLEQSDSDSTVTNETVSDGSLPIEGE